MKHLPKKHLPKKTSKRWADIFLLRHMQ